jgi:hypothetical protein
MAIRIACESGMIGTLLLVSDSSLVSSWTASRKTWKLILLSPDADRKFSAEAVCGKISWQAANY